MGIYKSEKGKEAILALYEKQLKRINMKYKDIYINTAFGDTYLIETGNMSGSPLLVFHGGNATTAYNLLACDFLMNDFHIYAVDTIGHPGKSAEVSLSPNNYDYGKWAAEKDCLFPAKNVIPRAMKIINNCTTYLLEGRGHMHFLTEDEKKMIVDFLA